MRERRERTSERTSKWPSALLRVYSLIIALTALVRLLAVLDVGGVVVVGSGVGRPQRQVVTQQLHDQSAVLVRLLVEGVQFSDRLVKCLQGWKEVEWGGQGDTQALKTTATMSMTTTPKTVFSIKRERENVGTTEQLYFLAIVTL